MQSHSAVASCSSRLCRNLKLGVSSLDGAPRELWLCFVIQIISEYGTHALDISMQVFASQEFGYSDLQTGSLYGFRGLATSGCSFLVAGFIDIIGIRKALVIGSAVTLVGHSLVASAVSEWMLLVGTLVVSPLGEVLTKQALQVSVIRFTTRGSKAFAFGILYSCLVSFSNKIFC